MRSLLLTLTVSFLVLACGGGVDVDVDTGPPVDAAPERVEAAAAPITAVALPVAAELGGDRSDCSLSFDAELEPALAEEQEDGSQPTVERGPGGMHEQLTLPSGVQVRLTRGGCNSYGETLVLAPAQPGAARDAAWQVLRELMWSSPETTALSRCVEEAAAGVDGGWECGDAFVSAERQGQVLTITYAVTM